MPSVNSVNSVVKIVYDANSDINDEKRKLQNTVFNSTAWWKGTAGEELRSMFSNIQTDVDTLVKAINNLINTTKSLAGDIKNADDQREIERKKNMKSALVVNKTTVKYK